ncbi:MAG: terpene cyclase/mutase family protein [Pirellulales bacterium]|nr:terpene cyclase/mutase family protein [Pirellulales bacterium]
MLDELKYLERLTLRLAAGMNQLPDEVRARHAEFLLSKQNPDGGFSGREGGSDLYYTSFALRSLAITGKLEGEPAERAAEFLQSCLGKQAAIIDFLSLLYGAMLLDTSAGIDIFQTAADRWEDRVAAEMERFRRDDGGYAASDEGFSSSTYYTFLVLLCLQIVELPPQRPEQIVEFLLSRRREDGGFVELGPMKRSGTNPSAAAIGALQILDAVDTNVREEAIDFLLDRQTDEGGFAANTRIPFADVLSTFTALLTLTDLGARSEVDLAEVAQFLSSTEQPSGGFTAGLLDQVPDVEYTFYGLGVRALLEDVR